MTIRPVESAEDLRRFIDLPYRLYRDDPHWVAPLRSDERTRLTPGKNPFFEHAEASYFLSGNGDRDSGRIAVSVDRNYDSIHGERQAAFGFFESTSAVSAAALLGAAEAWARSKRAAVLRGPLSFTTNDECGLLVEGFDRRPSLLMPYNPPSYADWIEEAAFRKAKDLYFFRAPIPDAPQPTYSRIAGRVRRQEGVRTRPIDMRRFNEELARVKELYNSAWERNWGFVPMTDREIDHMAAQLKPAVVPELIRFAEVDGVPVGFALLMPDLNIALQKIRGRLFPFGFVRLLLDMRRIREVRFLALGIRSDWRRKGIAPLLVEELIRVLRRLRYTTCSIGWTLEENEPVNQLIEAVGGARVSTYRIYERSLADRSLA